jgi:hypothetical protein
LNDATNPEALGVANSTRHRSHSTHPEFEVNEQTHSFIPARYFLVLRSATLP